MKRGDPRHCTREAAGAQLCSPPRATFQRLRKLRGGDHTHGTHARLEESVGLESGELSWVGGMGYPKQKNRLVAVLHRMFLVGYKGESTKVKVVPRVKHRLRHSVTH